MKWVQLLLLRKKQSFEYGLYNTVNMYYGRFFGLKHKIPKKDTAAAIG